MAEKVNKMTRNDFSQRILGSIDILVDRAMTSAKFDKTISASIISCVDAATGKYKVQYQDAVYYATSESIDDEYSDGSEVYILIPQGDFSKPKKILGKVSTSTDTNVTESEKLLSYNEIGENIVSMEGSYGICSYRVGELEGIKVLYDNSVSDNLIQIDNASFAAALKEQGCAYFGVSADFKTSLNEQQQDIGNYALLVSLIYEDESGNSQEYEYKLDTNTMTGNPYLYLNWTSQKSMFELPLGTFKEIGSIIFVAEDFSTYSPEVMPNDIFIQNIKIVGMAASDSLYFNTYNLVVHGSAGLQLSTQILETTLTPEVYYHDKPVDVQQAECYWFRENATVTTSHSRYLSYGGMGWSCLNSFNTIVLEDDSTQKEWLSMNSYTLQRSENPVKQIKYKCVVLLTNGAVIEKVFYVGDRDYLYDIQLSSSANDFENGNGCSTLTCTVSAKGNATLPEIGYAWGKITNNGTFSCIKSLDEISVNGEGVILNKNFKNYTIATCLTGLKTAIENCITNEVFNSTTKFKKYLISDNSNSFKKAFQEEIAKEVFTQYLSSALASLLNVSNLESVTYKKVLEAISIYTQRNYITYIRKNVYSDLPASAVLGSATYVCTAFLKGESDSFSINLGSSSVIIKNKTDNSANSTLTIVNGEQIFKYDKDGRSPSLKTSENPNPQSPLALTFNVFDSQGNQINDEKIHTGKGAIISNWSWYVPIENTMIQLSDEIIEKAEVTSSNFYRIPKMKQLPFSIKDTFSNELAENKIRLNVAYNNKTLRAFTNLSFIKDGSNGTNGTDFFCKVSINGPEIREWPAIIYDETQASWSPKLNFTPDDSDYWLKASLYRNNEEIEVEDKNIKWRILKNEYKNTKGEIKTTASHFKIDSSTKVFSFNDELNDSGARAYTTVKNPSNIARAEISYKPQSTKTSNVFLDNQTIYGAFPISTIILKDKDYIIRMKPTSGYNEVIYDSDGTNPQYLDRAFEAQVFSITDTAKEDNLANNKGKNSSVGTPFKCEFAVYGHGKLLTIEDWENANYPNNTCIVKPSERYTGYETNNGIVCNISKYNGTDSAGKAKYLLIGTIYHPIHMFLNKYGMASLNGWDGNSINIDNDNGVILSPQIGAGYKEEDNTFTGMIMGTVRKDFNDTTGLFGYKGGSQTLLLNAESGEAKFGLEGKGQIILSPGSFTINESTGKGEFQNTSATIKGGNFVYNPEGYKGTGMEIDLTEPSIRYGSGRFEVDSDGVLTASEADIKGILTAYGGSQIGPWHITNNAIYKLGDEPLPEDEDDQEEYEDLMESNPGEDTKQDKESESGEGSGGNSSDEGSSGTEEEGSSENPDNSND